VVEGVTHDPNRDEEIVKRIYMIKSSLKKCAPMIFN